MLAEVVDGFGKELGFHPSPAERRAIADSIPSWVPFADTVPALKALASRYQLTVISNIDDDLFPGGRISRALRS